MINSQVESALLAGKVGIMPTDTLYGLVGKALNQNAVERIYKIKQRNRSKPFIILIDSVDDLEKFGIKIDKKTKSILGMYWPGPVSVILSTKENFTYLHSGKNSLAFRVPAVNELRAMIRKVGPLVAPSANPEGLSPAETIDQAKRYFGERVDFYLDGGLIKSKPSKIIDLTDNGKIIRQ